MTPPEPAIRLAATLILAREGRILMGQRGAAAAFMPSKYVFPGGSVDASDQWSGPLPLSPSCAARLGPEAGPVVAAALRELTEETGLSLRRDAPLRYVFRAITPPGRTRRFDARFFLADAAGLAEDPDDLSRADPVQV